MMPLLQHPRRPVLHTALRCPPTLTLQSYSDSAASPHISPPTTNVLHSLFTIHPQFHTTSQCLQSITSPVCPTQYPAGATRSLAAHLLRLRLISQYVLHAQLDHRHVAAVADEAGAHVGDGRAGAVGRLLRRLRLVLGQPVQAVTGGRQSAPLGRARLVGRRQLGQVEPQRLQQRYQRRVQVAS